MVLNHRAMRPPLETGEAYVNLQFLRPPLAVDSQRTSTIFGLQPAANCLFCNCDRHSPHFLFGKPPVGDHFIPSLSAAKQSGAPGVSTPCKDIPVDASTPKPVVTKENGGRKCRPLTDPRVF